MPCSSQTSQTSGRDTALRSHQRPVSCPTRCFSDKSMARLNGQPVSPKLCGTSEHIFWIRRLASRWPILCCQPTDRSQQCSNIVDAIQSHLRGRGSSTVRSQPRAWGVAANRIGSAAAYAMARDTSARFQKARITRQDKGVPKLPQAMRSQFKPLPNQGPGRPTNCDCSSTCHTQSLQREDGYP